MAVHAKINDDVTLCGIKIYEKYPGRAFPSNVTALDTAISGNAPKVTCSRCQKSMYR